MFVNTAQVLDANVFDHLARLMSLDDSKAHDAFQTSRSLQGHHHKFVNDRLFGPRPTPQQSITSSKTTDVRSSLS
ncbi:hypothetical protein E4U54_002249 [Claviceps lovelessii]|nr:hypothetical protein E4U54_002249 [Claviceps lovelessii]